MKRFFDFTISAILLIFLMPLILVVSILVFLLLGRPVFFRQKRPGLKGRPFMLLKFRSMTSERDEEGNLKPDHERMTKLGRYLRSSSLDELPSLLNVLKGDMSLVGPRPLLMEYLPLYNERQMRRHEVRPGITGWSQVNGRNLTSWKDRLEMDVWYIENQSFWLDIKILFSTVLKVVKREGINASGHETMPKFQGNEY